MGDDDRYAYPDLTCIMCPVCNTMMLVREALANRCSQAARRSDCPLPVRIVEETPAVCR